VTVAFGTAPLLFDCDGTLVASEPLYAQVDAVVLAPYGMPLNAEDIRVRYMGVAVGKMLADMEQTYGATFPTDIIDQLDAAVNAKMDADLQAIAGIPDALAFFETRGHKMAVATNSQLGRTRRNLHTTKLDVYFNDCIASLDQVAHGKPLPDVYLLAAQKLGVHPRDCIAIEDSPIGMRAVIAANMIGIGYAPADHGAGIGDALLESGAHIIITDMRDLPRAVETAEELRALV
jgi:HAD superfamily hydrolase (TIGR01509 family)